MKTGGSGWREVLTVIAVFLHPLLTARDLLDHGLNHKSYGASGTQGYLWKILFQELRMTGVSVGSLLLACMLFYGVTLPKMSGWVIVGMGAALYLLFGLSAYSAQQQYTSAVDQFGD